MGPFSDLMFPCDVQVEGTDFLDEVRFLHPFDRLSLLACDRVARKGIVPLIHGGKIVEDQVSALQNRLYHPHLKKTWKL